MYLKKLSFLLLILGVQLLTAQVKIGENPNTIDPASIVELQSTSKAFVLTRVTSSQMQSIRPLHGAMVYNTETRCIHYFDANQWKNLCNSSGTTGNFSFVDNGNGTFTINYSDGTSFTSADLTGAQGIQGDKGHKGDQGNAGVAGPRNPGRQR